MEHKCIIFNWWCYITAIKITSNVDIIVKYLMKVCNSFTNKMPKHKSHFSYKDST